VIGNTQSVFILISVVTIRHIIAGGIDTLLFVDTNDFDGWISLNSLHIRAAMSSSSCDHEWNIDGSGPPLAVHHMMNGETHFSTIMAYSAEQRSDAATVCSGSVADEIESVVSQEELRQSPISVSSKRNLKQAPPSPEIMGPPLSRALLLQKERCNSAQSFESQAFSDGATVAHSDCGGSLDLETNSVHSQEDAKPKEVASRNHSGSIGSLSEDEKQHDRDSDGSIPVHTVEARSELQSGRRSPGGTIYKGRGVRRYMGRYMHLPLKRFHENGVTLDATTTSTSERDGHHMVPGYDHRMEDCMDRQGGNVSGRSRDRSRSRSP